MSYFGSDEGTSSKYPCYIQLSNGTMATVFTTSLACSSSCRMIGSPIESGKMKFDHKVRNPIVVTMTGVAKPDSFAVLKQVANVEIKSMDPSKVCTAYLKDGNVIPNLMIENFTSKATNDKFDAVEVSMTLKELMTYKS